MKFVWIFTCVYCVNANKWKHFNLIYTSRSLSWNQSIRGVMTEVLFSSSFCSRLISLFDWCFLISSQHPLVSNMYSVRVFPSMGKSFGHFYYISAENFLSREFNLIDVETTYWSSTKDLLLGFLSVQSPYIKPNEYSLFLHAMLRVISFSGNRVCCSANGIYVNPKYF